MELAATKLRLGAFHRGAVVARLYDARRELSEPLVQEARLTEVGRQNKTDHLRQMTDGDLAEAAENARQAWNHKRARPFDQGATLEEDGYRLDALRHDYSYLMLAEAEIARRAALSAHQKIEEFALRAAGKPVAA